ncbi:hypothetical protein [Aeoliella sp.]|uniref:hypothetical protein n=1 Tax=Aeoliella sp. TaxID=2795800 RepID=UPI003CCBABF5
MLRWIVCLGLLAGTMAVTMDSADARLFGRRTRSSYSSPSKTYRSTPRRGGYVVRGASPIPMHVSPARYRYLKTFYPNMVRDAR